jgi:hypothetical protein
VRHIEKDNPDITQMEPLNYTSYLSKKEPEEQQKLEKSDDDESYDEECELIGRINGIEYFTNIKDQIICINSENYGEIVGKKGDKLWKKIYQ